MDPTKTQMRKRNGCVVTGLIFALLLLVAMPCGLLITAGVTGNDVWVNAPLVGLYITHSNPAGPVSPMLVASRTSFTSTITLGAGSCKYQYSQGKGGNPTIQVGAIWLTLLDCDPKILP
jgi:hypothetical protein